MTHLERMMRDWLETGTDAQKAHAARRLTIPFRDAPPVVVPPVARRTGLDRIIGGVDLLPIYRRWGRRDRIVVPDDCGVVCASDSGQFNLLQLLLTSLLLSHRVPVTVVDLGFTEDQRRWLGRQSVSVVPLGVPVMPQDVANWQAWVKPQAIALCPYRRVLWLDNDVLVDGDLSAVFEAISTAPVLVRDHFADPGVLPNAPELYDRYPVGGEPLKNLCTGVVGLDMVRDQRFIHAWVLMVKEAAIDETVRCWLRWWDQGAAMWAASLLGLPVADHREWNTPGRVLDSPTYGMRYGTPAELFDALDDQGVVTHLQGQPKPVGWSRLDIELHEAPFKVFVLGHEVERLESIPPRPFLHAVNLNDLPYDPTYAETRFFLWLMEHPEEVERLPEYVGFATARWDEKYGDRALPLVELHRLKDCLSPDRVICAERAPHDWSYWTDFHNDGLEPYLDEIKTWVGPQREGDWASFWSQNAIMHKSVLVDYLAFLKRAHARILERWGTRFEFTPVDDRRPGSYIYEGVSVAYFAARRDLEIVTTLDRPPARVVVPPRAIPPIKGCGCCEKPSARMDKPRAR